MPNPKLLDVITILEKAGKYGIRFSLEEDELLLLIDQKETIDEHFLHELRNNKDSIIAYLKEYQPEIRETDSAKNIIHPSRRQEVEFIPLSYSQERLWFIDQLQGSTQYHVPNIFRLKGTVNRAGLIYALQTLVDRHEVLRTVISAAAGVASQQILDSMAWQLEIVEDTRYNEDTVALHSRIQDIISTPFDLSQDYMLRAHLIVPGEEEQILVITIHHIAADAWSVGILIKELITLYNAFTEDRPAQLPSLSVQYADYAIWQRSWLSGKTLADKIAYWKNKLEDVSPLQLPADYPRPVIQSSRGALYRFNLDKELSDQLKEMSKQQGTTLFMTTLAAFKILLFRYSGQKDICVGTSMTGRDQKELEGLIGFFINTLALRSNLEDNPDFISLLQQVKQTTLDAYGHQEVPFEKIVEVVEKERDMSKSSLFQVMFELFNTPDVSVPELSQGQLQLFREKAAHVTTLFDIGFSLAESRDGLSGNVEYCIDLFSENTIARMVRHYEQLLREIIKNPKAGIDSYTLLCASEARQLLTEFNNTEQEYPQDKTIIELFALQVARTPDAIAIVMPGEYLTYRELDRRTTQLAHQLSAKGITTDRLVPVCIERSLNMAVALLGIMKAGAAYVPIDPAYPAERIDYILEDIGADIVVCSEDCKHRITGNKNIEVLVPDYDMAILEKCIAPDAPSPNHLAYVIYTSGSTGKPKGVMVEHGGMLNHLLAKINELQIDAETVLAFTASYTFDISVWQLFAALLCGGRTVIYQHELILEPARFMQQIDADGITILELVPSHLSELLQEETGVSLKQLKYMVVTGEAVHQSLLKQWFNHRDYGRIPVVNAYGPTEASDDITHYIMREAPLRTNIPLGKPIQNLRIYILDSLYQLCPVGITGEICVAGIGVGRGYLNNPGLTADRFVKDPFNPTVRMYRTGDLGRWLPDGNIEYLGRVDDQVKIRGFRIELGEIEAVLQQSELVNQAAILVRQDNSSQKKLVGYYVPESQTVKVKEALLFQQQENDWHELWETEYARTEEVGKTAAEFNLTGWNDSFSGMAIPEDDMREWLNDIVEVILSAPITSMLEIGCGAGLIYYQMVGHIEKYTGIDFSSVSIGTIRQRISMGDRNYPVTILKTGAAHEITLDADETTDLIIINSVVQYFPGENYLSDVLDKCMPFLKRGGRIVLGDIRDNRLQKLFKCRLNLEKFQPRAGIREFCWKVDEELLKEEELCLSPEYFYRLQKRYPEITDIDIQRQKGTYINELSLYRYTVVIHVGIEKEVMAPLWQRWDEISDIESIRKQINNNAAVIALQDVPDPRLWKERLLENGLKDPSVLSVGDLMACIAQPDKNTLGVNELLFAARNRGYHCRLLLNEQPLKINLLLELQPFPGFIAPVNSKSADTSYCITANVPMYAKIAELLSQDIRKKLLQQLPDYMVPTDLIALQHLPLTGNGKIDRKFLSQRENMQWKSLINYQSPVTTIELLLVDIWQELLGVARVGIYDDFFELGGHSLLATRTVSAIRKSLGVELTVKDFFLYPTVAKLAIYLQQRDKGLLLPVIEVGPRPLHIPLSYSQERLWFIDQLEGSVQYHISNILKLSGSLDKDALENALRKIVGRHEVLRTVIEQEGGIPYQRIQEENGWELKLVSDTIYREDKPALQACIAALIAVPFELSRDYMLRAHLIVLDDAEHMLVVTQHHIASDGWSTSIIVRELGELYEAAMEKRITRLTPLNVQYADYAIWQRKYLLGTILDKKLNYWKEKLDSVDIMQLPTDYPRPRIQSSRGAGTVLRLEQTLLDELKTLSRKQSTTLYMTLLTVFKVLLYRYSGQEDICVGTPIAGRTQQEIEGLIGFFVNTLVLRSNLGNNPSFISLLEQVKQTTLDAYEHQEVPFEKVVEAVVKDRDLSRNPLFQVMFVLQNVPETSDLHLGTLQLSGESFKKVSTPFDLTFSVQEFADGLGVNVTYCTDLFSEDTIGRMMTHYETLLRAVVDAPHEKIGNLPMLGAAETQQLLVTFNETAAKDFPHPDKTIIDIFNAQVAHTPDAAALVFEDGYVTYKTLDERTNQLARYLIAQGVTTETLVAICIERSLEMIIGILGILKAGGAYVPVDPEYPMERIRYMLEDTGAGILLSNIACRNKLPDTGHTVHIIMLDEDWPVINEYPGKAPVTSLIPANLAYIIYTSGSTGKPKGVMIEHSSVVNLAIGQREALSLKEGMRTLQFASLSFDASCYEIFNTLLSGGCLVLCRKEDILSTEKFEALINKYQVELITLPPSYQHMIREITGPVKTIVSAGETLNSADAIYLMSRGIRLINAYGPTENTVCTTLSDQPVKENGTVVIGKPIKNIQVYILDAQKGVCPVNVIGEIFIGGAGVARGYLNQPGLSAERFVLNPFRKGERMYKTGDLGRWLPDGNIAFIGRKDNQVKIRGYRIELGEIEAVLQSAPGIDESIVLAKFNKEGDQELVAYVVSKVTLNSADLYEHLSKVLPVYMIPGNFVQLPFFPLTTSGKIDRKSLSDLKGLEMETGVAYAPPRNEVEEKLVLIWQEILGKERIGIKDNFFESGGHSLKATRLAHQLYKVFSVKISLKELFIKAVLEEQARLISKAKKAAYQNIIPIPVQEHYELSPSQYRLWLMDQMGIVNASYNIYGECKFEEDIDPGVFKQSIKELVTRHEVLRTVFIETDGIPKQKVVNVNELNFDIDLVAVSEEREIDVNTIKHKIFNNEFKLDVWPLFKMLFIKEGGHNRLFYSMHHIISDGWSMELFARDVSAIYKSQLTGDPVLLPDLKIQYKDYAGWQNNLLLNEETNSLEEYWTSHLKGQLPDMRLPYDYEAYAEVSDNEAKYFELYIDEAKKNEINKFLVNRKVSLFSLLIAGFKVILNRLTGEADLIIGVPVANREHDDIRDLIGFFLNTLMLRDELKTDSFFEVFLEQVNNTILEGLEHQSYPFEKLLEKLKIQRDYNRFPVSSVFCNMLNFNSTEEIFLHNKVPKHGEVAGYAKFDLECYFKEYTDGISVKCIYKSKLFKPETIEYWMNEFVSVIKQVVSNSQIEIKKIKIFEQQISRINDPVPVNPFTYFKEESVNQSIITRFEEQVRKYPDNIAINQDGKCISYSALNAWANGLAEKIITITGSAGVNTALLLEHGESAITGMLGVLKSGNVYVPLDPHYPVNRLNYLLEDTGCRLIIADNTTIELVKTLSKERNDISIINISVEIAPVQANPDVEISPDSKAYILYTSGSTGVAKGVVQNHRNVLHFIRVYTNNLHIGINDKLSLLPVYGFDSSVMDIYGGLLNGAALYPYNLKQNGTIALAAWLYSNKISILHTVPTIYRYFIAGLKEEVFHNIRLIVLGGEAVYKSDVEKFKKHFVEGAIFINGYGPTESTITLQKFLDHNSVITSLNIPVGFPVQDTQVYLLNENDETAGIYQTGEIVYKSDYLSLGYLNKASQTNAVFTIDPVTNAGRVYRSGDIGRMLPTGEIEFIGRKDNQVKISGQRVELSDIEQNILRIDGVHEAVVLFSTFKEQDRLIAYVRSEKEVNEHMIRQKLHSNLPLHMIPDIYMFMDSFPLTTTGKISRLDLPAPTEKEIKSAEYTAPRNKLEEKLGLIWQEILGKEKIGIKDNFFESGGNSLLVIRLIWAIRKELDMEVSTIDVFSCPTIALLSGILEQRNNSEVLSDIGTEANKHVLLLNKGKKEYPLFIAPGTTGICDAYFELAAALNDVGAVYGLYMEGLFEGEQPLDSITAIAAKNIAWMKEIQPVGPYRLVGHSFGGIVAYEMTKQLESNGEKMDLVAILDTVVLSGKEKQVVDAGGQEIFTSLVWVFEQYNIIASTHPLWVAELGSKVLSLEPKEVVPFITDFIKDKINREHAGFIMRLFNTYKMNASILYNFDGIIYSSLSLIKAAVTNWAGFDECLGWSKYAADVKVFTSPGAHSSMVKDDNAKILAGYLKELLKG
ncbi:amino acid adenylation domain-containing protein [Chitinophaga niastensis]|uniref:Amino acid adenylation domain-containing protein n=1 Tax=Chitinophaga niastensis TaxID=536980 RepID=A0A2P8HFK5_CHINA|nr:non-ribosomal peptide synthetase [Chitinophaga niastensis]PSL44995.1 amino acid adenylation domain-containing protein [Chitinophaga niastensis]